MTIIKIVVYLQGRFWRCTQVGRRGAPAKGVGRVTGARVQISPSPPSKGYKKDVAQETPDFIGGFAVSTAEILTGDFVDVKEMVFPL